MVLTLLGRHVCANIYRIVPLAVAATTSKHSCAAVVTRQSAWNCEGREVVVHELCVIHVFECAPKLPPNTPFGPLVNFLISLESNYQSKAQP